MEENPYKAPAQISEIAHAPASTTRCRRYAVCCAMGVWIGANLGGAVAESLDLSDPMMALSMVIGTLLVGVAGLAIDFLRWRKHAA